MHGQKNIKLMNIISSALTQQLMHRLSYTKSRCLTDTPTRQTRDLVYERKVMKCWFNGDERELCI